MKLIEVYEFLKTRCPNHIVRYGFGWDCAVGLFNGMHRGIKFDMVEHVRVSTMVGNLSHAVLAGHGEQDMFWPESFDSPLVESITEDTLEEMGMKPNT